MDDIIKTWSNDLTRNSYIFKHVKVSIYPLIYNICKHLYKNACCICI